MVDKFMIYSLHEEKDGMRWYQRIAALLLPCWAILACQPQERIVAPMLVDDQTNARPIEIAAMPAVPDWGQGGDCRGMLALLRDGLVNGRIADLEGTPFTLIEEEIAQKGAFGFGRIATAGLEPPPSFGDARCVIRIGRAIDRASEHQVLSRETVRSRYKSGTRSEKNPAHEVAKIRLRQAEKAAKPGKSSLMKIDDPLMNLVGTLAGGVLGGLGQWGAGDQLEEALDHFMATPPRIERPKYKSYQFELRHVRASREAMVPVILTDRHLARSWDAALKQKEQRQFAVMTGVDRQDEDYDRLRQEHMSEQRFQRWLANSPSLQIADIAAGLLARPREAPLDRLAIADVEEEGGDGELMALAIDESFDAAALPSAQQISRFRETSPMSASSQTGAAAVTAGGVQESFIKIIGETMEAEGVFIAPHFILVPSEAVADRGLVDIEDRPGHTALGLVAALDRGLGLALIQSPKEGSPVAIGYSIGRPAKLRSTRGGMSKPWLVEGRLSGFRMAKGPDIESDAIKSFLERQRHLLPRMPELPGPRDAQSLSRRSASALHSAPR